MFTLDIEGKRKTFQNKVRLLDLLDDRKKRHYIALVNNRLRELHYEVDYDAEVEFLDSHHPEAVHAYEASLRFLVAMAFKNIYPDYDFKFNYSISRSVFCHILNLEEGANISEIIKKIESEMERLVAADLSIVRHEMEKEEAKEFYQKHGYNDKLEVIRYRPEDIVHFYECDGYLNYMYSLMVPSTGYLKEFSMRAYPPGFLVQYPRAEAGAKIPTFEDAPIYGRTLRQANRWVERIDAHTIARINKHAGSRRVADFVQMNESRHNQMLAEIGQTIEEAAGEIRLIAIAGPSSSGKTTFSHRLRVELMTRGLKPVMISLDDYYLDRDQIEPDENGQIDLEHINTLDIDLFNRNMLDLIQGREVDIPHFDFMIKRRTGYKKLKIRADNPIIIEGIHALNETLTELIPHHQKYKIFISPQLQINIDHHNPISITNLRLLRRIVRDRKFRNAPASKTIRMWPSVRKGEFRWIYPHQEGSDYIFNSSLAYELCVMKKHALDTLMEIPRDSEHFITANRLIKFLKYFKDIDDELVPNNSLLKEFLGGSCFD